MADSGAKVTAFLRGEDQLKQDWLCLLMDDEHAPLDVCYKANLLKIEREFYPYAVYDLVCEANWEATSYWEHTETYQVAREETVYIDYQGNEHKHSGYDNEVTKVHGEMTAVKRYRQPMSRTVYDTKKKTVVDNVEDTDGYVEPTKMRKVVWTGPAENKPTMMAWADRFSEGQLHPINANGLPGIEIPEALSAAQALDAAKQQAADTMASKARGQIPGNRYENLQISYNVISENRTTCYLSTYHVYYEYGGKQYDCILTGGDSTSDVIINDRPIDTTIKTHAENLDESIKQSSGALFLFIAIVAGLAGLFAAYTGFAGWPQNIIKGVIGLALVIVAVVCGYRYKGMNENHKAFKAQRENFTAGNAELKQRIYNLIQDDSIPEEQKGPMIEKWVNSYLAGIGD